MERNTTQYPEPEQLRAYASDPMPFHGIVARDLELVGGDYLRAEFGTVEYRYRPAYITLENESTEYEYIPTDSTNSDGIDHRVVWDSGGNVEVEEDYICLRSIMSVRDWSSLVDAYWILDTVTFNREE